MSARSISASNSQQRRPTASELLHDGKAVAAAGARVVRRAVGPAHSKPATSRRGAQRPKRRAA